MKLSFNTQEFVRLFFLKRGDRNSSPTGNHFLYVITRDPGGNQFVFISIILQVCRVARFAGPLADFIPVGQTPLFTPHAQFDACTRLVNYINGFVR